MVGHQCHGSSVEDGGLVYGVSSPFYFHVGSKVPNMGHQASTASAFILPAPNFSNLIKFKQNPELWSGSGMQKRKWHDYICDLLKQIQALPPYVIAMGAPLPKAFGMPIDETDINNFLWI